MSYLPQKTITIIDEFNNQATCDFFGNLHTEKYNTDIAVQVKNNTISLLYDMKFSTIDVSRTIDYVNNVMTMRASSNLSFTAITRETTLFCDNSDCRAYFGVSFPTNQANVQSKASLFNSEAEIGIGYQNAVFGIFYQQNVLVAPSFIPQSSWTNPSPSGLLPSNMNNYCIRYFQNGFIGVFWYSFGQGWVLLHSINTVSSSLTFGRNNFSFGLFLSGATNNSGISFNYVSCGYYGEDRRRKKYISWVSPFKTVGTTGFYVPFASILCSQTLNSLQHLGRLKILSVTYSNNSQNNFTAKCFFNPVLTGANFTTIYTGSVDYFVSVDSTASAAASTVVPVLHSANIGGDQQGISNYTYDFPNFYFYSGEIITFGLATTHAVGASVAIDIVQEF